MRLKTWIWLVLVVLLSSTAWAQEQRGAVEGVVVDVQGGVLPGVTVEATNTAVGSTVSAVTDSRGEYRFLSLPPGTYAVSASLSGFAPKKAEGIAVSLGQIKKVDLSLSPATVSETVQVTATSPQIGRAHV